MHARVARRRTNAVVLATLLLALMGISTVRTSAQTASAPALKAAFLYNFTKFTEWPPEALPSRAPLVLCIVEDENVAGALEEATAGRNVDGHPLLVRRIEVEGPIRSCHLLYATGLDSKKRCRLIESLRAVPVLAVSDFPGFASQGGTANLFFEDGRMRFAVNLEATTRSKLRLSSRLLTLAKIVKEEANADAAPR
jgi:hypothetical protein